MQDQRWARWWGRRYSWALEGRPWLDFEDLVQAAMLGILRAREGFTEDKGSWANWSAYFIRNEIRDLIGIKNARLPPLVLSLDAPIAEDSDETRLDLLPDETAPNAEDVAEFNDLQRCVREAVARLKNEQQRQVVRRTRLGGESGRDVAAALGVTQARVNQLWNSARQHLARDRRLRALADIEDRTPYYKRVGARTFNSTWTSATEAAVLWRLDRESEVAAYADPKTIKITGGATGRTDD